MCQPTATLSGPRLSQYRAVHAVRRAAFVPDENVDCPSGEPLQTREHLIQHCSQYEATRHHLHTSGRGAALSTVLGTKNGIAKLADFLRASGALTKTDVPRATGVAPLFSDEPSDDERERRRKRRRERRRERHSGSHEQAMPAHTEGHQAATRTHYRHPKRRTSN